jgi:hypothetical protein
MTLNVSVVFVGSAARAGAAIINDATMAAASRALLILRMVERLTSTNRRSTVAPVRAPLLALGATAIALGLPTAASAGLRISMPAPGDPLIATDSDGNGGHNLYLAAYRFQNSGETGVEIPYPDDLGNQYTEGDDPVCAVVLDGTGERLDCKQGPGPVTFTGSDFRNVVQINAGDGTGSPAIDVESISTKEGDDTVNVTGLGARGKIDGGPDGIDGDTFAAFNARGNWTINLDAGTAFASGGTSAALSFTDFENIEPNSTGGHTLIGNDKANRILAQQIETRDSEVVAGSVVDGRGGDDDLVGGNGDDTITGGAGADRIYCGLGTDTVKDAEASDTIDSSCEILNRFDVSLAGDVTDADLFSLTLGLRNTAPAGGTPITGITFPRGVLLRDDGLQANGPTLTRYFGPTAALPTSLDPGQSGETLFAFSVESPGVTVLHSLAEGTDNTGAKQSDRGSVILDASYKEPTRQEFDALVAGGLISLWNTSRQVRNHIFKRFTDKVLATLRGNPKTRKLAKASTVERELARANGLPDTSLAWLPKRLGQLATPRKPGGLQVFMSMLDGFEEGSHDAVKGVVDRTLLTPYQFWSDFVGNPEDGHRVKIAMELAKGVTEGATATTGYLGTAADYWTDPAKRKAAAEQWPAIVKEQRAKLNALDRAATTAIIEWDDLMKDNPVKGARQFGKVLGRIEGEVLVASVSNTVGDKLKGGLTRFDAARKGAGVVEESLEAGASAVDATHVAGEAAEAAEDLAGYTPDQVSLFQSIAKKVGDKFGVPIEIQPRPINEYANKIKGALGKVEAVGTKNLTPDDLVLGAPAKWIGQPTYYKPKLPRGFAKLAEPIQERLKLRLADKAEELGQFLGEIEDKTGKTENVHRALEGATEFTLGTNGKLRMKLAKTVDKATGAILIEYEELAVNGRKIPINGRAPIVSDSDINAVLNAATGKHLPAGIRGQVELTVMDEMRKAAEAGKIPWGFHAWTHSGFDVASDDYKNVLKYMLMYLPEDEAARVAAKYAKIYGTTAESFLKGYTKGKFLLKITGSSVSLGPGASPLRPAFEPPF